MKKNWWNSLRIKIIAWTFVPAVIILSAVAWFTFYSYQKVIGDLAIKQDWAIAQSKAVEAYNAFATLVNPHLRPIVLNIDINYEESLKVRAEKILTQTQGLDIFDGGIYFLDQQGKVYITWPSQPELIGEDWSDTPQYRYIRSNPPGTSPVTDIRTIGKNEQDIICSTWPMLNMQGEFIGAGYYCFLIKPAAESVLYKLLNSLSLGPDVYIIDGNQRIIYSPDPSRLGRDLSKADYIQQLFQDPNMSIRFQKGTEQMVISYFPVWNVVSDRMRWVLIKEQSLADIMQPSLPYRQLLYVLLALGVVVPVLVTAYGVRHITNPIQKLIQASGQVTAGQFKHQIEVKTGDEIETLANQFNLMSAELDESYSSLEKKVADRTRELAIMNSILSVASRSMDIQEILESALNIIVEQMGFEVGAAFTHESDSTPPVLISQRGFDGFTTPDLVKIEMNYSQVNAADLQSGVTTFEIKDLQDEKLRSQLNPSRAQLFVHVPLSSKGRNLGTFILGRKDSIPPSQEGLSLLGSIGQQIGVAVEIANLYERAEQTAITAERSRLARELHDAVTQTLFSANLIADVIPRIWKNDPEEGLKNLEELRQLTRGALAEMRTMLLEMRPETLERVDIKSLLTQLSDAFIGRVRVPVSLVIQGDCELTREVKIVFYRVAQEAMNNIAKHSGARQVEVHLDCQTGQMNLMIKDDGLGFDPGTITPEHLGIAIMRERASSIGANLKIESQVGQGTSVELNWRSTRKD